MPTPRLIHPLDVEIQPGDEADTVYDRDAREPVRGVRRGTTIQLKAQVSWRDVADPQWTAMGVSEEVRGYLLFREVDLDAAGYVPPRNGGDRIVKIGIRTTALYTLQPSDAGHYPSAGGASLVLVFFADRRPSDPRSIS